MNDNFLNRANAPYVAELFYKYRQDPNSVDSSWGSFFNSLNDDDLAVLGDFGGPEWKKRPSKIIDEMISKNIFWNGTRHIFSPDIVSKYELCQHINNIYKLNINIANFDLPKKVDRTLSSIYKNSLFF